MANSAPSETGDSVRTKRNHLKLPALPRSMSRF